MSRKTLIRVSIIIIVLIAISIFTFVIDVNRIIDKREPIFCIQKAVYEDGGTVEYLGLFYKIYKFKNKNNVETMKFGGIFSTYESVVGDEIYD